MTITVQLLAPAGLFVCPVLSRIFLGTRLGCIALGLACLSVCLSYSRALSLHRYYGRFWHAMMPCDLYFADSKP